MSCGCPWPSKLRSTKTAGFVEGKCETAEEETTTPLNSKPAVFVANVGDNNTQTRRQSEVASSTVNPVDRSNSVIDHNTPSVPPPLVVVDGERGAAGEEEGATEAVVEVAMVTRIPGSVSEKGGDVGGGTGRGRGRAGGGGGGRRGRERGRRRRRGEGRDDGGEAEPGGT